MQELKAPEALVPFQGSPVLIVWRNPEILAEKINSSFSVRSECNHLVASMPISSTRAMIQSWFEVYIPNVRENQVSQFPDFSITVSSVINFLLVYIYCNEIH